MTTLREEFHAALSSCRDAVEDDLLPDVLCRSCLRVLPFDAAGLSLMGDSSSRVPLGASEPAAAAAERLQFTFGDGPCFRAMRLGEPVPVTEGTWTSQWPLMADRHFAQTAFHGGLSVPLRVFGSWIGVLDLYSRQSHEIGPSVVGDAESVAELVTTALLDSLGGPAGPLDEDEDYGVAARPEAAWLWGAPTRGRGQVWIATGMTNLALSLTSADALAVLRAHAFAEGSTVDALADDIVSGRLDVATLRSPV